MLLYIYFKALLAEPQFDQKSPTKQKNLFLKISTVYKEHFCKTSASTKTSTERGLFILLSAGLQFEKRFLHKKFSSETKAQRNFDKTENSFCTIRRSFDH